MNTGLAEPVRDLRARYIDSLRGVAGSIAIVAAWFEGERRGLAVTAWTSLSADPPAALVCVNRNAQAHDHIAAAGRFSINVLGTDHADLVGTFSSGSVHGEARFDPARWSSTPHGQPMLNGALAVFECALENRIAHSSHSMMIGRVDFVEHRRQPGLLYLDGKLASSSAVPT
jgi:flavin reductase (DIM6/NTAB) family NADH-FMN oxidoreductase RutF